ncbi:MAG: Ku protein [Burkholderiales bacterium]|nr:Ku protein [Burkholderiales bacterium]
MPRTIWKGAISFGLVNIPIGLYTAEVKKGLSFSLLDRRDLAPVGYQRINKETGEEVPWEEIVKGYEYEDGEYVVLGDEDFRQANVEATETVDILDFVDAAQIPVVYFEQPYYLAPGRKGEKGYALLRETLRQTNKVGIANVVIRTRQHIAALIPYGNMLVLNLLRFADELREPEDLELPGEDLAKLGVSKKELEMAERLVEGMENEFDPTKYHDQYREDLLALIDKKIKSGKTETISEPVVEDDKRGKAEVIDLMGLLKRSLDEKARPRAKASATQAIAKRPAVKARKTVRKTAAKDAAKTPTRKRA